MSFSHLPNWFALNFTARRLLELPPTLNSRVQSGLCPIMRKTYVVIIVCSIQCCIPGAFNMSSEPARWIFCWSLPFSLSTRLAPYRGWFPVISSLCCSNFVYFYTFNSLKTLWVKGQHSSTGKDLVLGVVAGKGMYWKYTSDETEIFNYLMFSFIKSTRGLTPCLSPYSSLLCCKALMVPVGNASRKHCAVVVLYSVCA